MIESTNSLLHLSVSSVETFQSCNAKYYYRYIAKLPTTSNYYATTGKFIHKILEIFIHAQKKHKDLRKSGSIAYRLAQKDKELIESLTLEIKEEGKGWVKNLVKKFEENPQLIPNVLKTEFPFTFKIAESDILVRGVIDRIDLTGDGNILIIDYKTSKSPDYLSAFQLATYAYAVQQQYPTKEITAAFELIRYDFERLNVSITQEERDRALDAFRNAGLEIRRLQQEKPTSPWTPTITKLCAYCPFRMKCEQDRSSSPWQV